MTSQNYINHVSVVLDRSGSMAVHTKTVPTVVDGLIKRLATRSQEMDQETRVTVYQFGDDVECLFYDKDVLRLPSIKGIYRIDGMTALLDATGKGLDDLAQTAQLYGDHAFLQYVITDGMENRSRKFNTKSMSFKLNGLDDNWTVALFVPDQQGVYEAKKFGFPKDNIQVWSTTSDTGVEEVGESIYTATDNYMQARQTGLRGTKSLFDLTTTDLKQAAKAGELQAVKPGQFNIYSNQVAIEIRPLVENNTHRKYVLGEAYYELVKREEVQADKDIAVLDNKSFTVYHGRSARQLLNLPNGFSTKVSPVDHPDFTIFVQSRSVNRKILPNERVLVLS